MLEQILSGLKIKASIERVEETGTVTRYYLRLHPGAKVSKIENCTTEIALGTKSHGRPIIKVIPEQGLICIELLNKKIQQVAFSEFDPWFKFELMKEYGEIPIILGKTHSGEELVVDLAQMPHLLVAGTTGSGKSMLLHSIICSIVKSDNRIRLALIDPKRVELKPYQNIKQLMYPIVSSPSDALDILGDLIYEMDSRFVLFNKAAVNNIIEYNKKEYPIPYIVAIIDEFGDLQRENKKEFQDSVCILAQKARVVGIHLIIATQHPTVGVISGVVKANFSSRIALKTASAIDSRVILDCNGAERLLGKGDALINSGSLEMVRFQGCFLPTEEIDKICSDYLKKDTFDLWSIIKKKIGL
ncbi:MAG: DNA translocase FtsK [Patescibacteria group bacterium]